MDRLPIQDELDDDHFRAIGILIVQWAQVERLMSLILCDLIANKSDSYADDAAIFYAVNGMQPNTLMGLLKTFTLARFGETEAKKLGKILTRLGKAKDTRDIAAHSVWFRGSKPGYVQPLGVKTVGNVKYLKGETHPDAIVEVAHAIYRHGHELEGMFRRLLPPADASSRPHPPSPDHSPEPAPHPQTPTP